MTCPSPRPLLPPGEADLVHSRPVYRYLTVPAFLHLVQSRSLAFTQVDAWPDAYEGTRRAEAPRCFGSCWSLEQHVRGHGESQEENFEANRERREHGSAAMWAAYCAGGGVRIQSTIEKVDAAHRHDPNGHDLFRSRVVYRAASLFGDQSDEHALMMKGITFRDEAEYRFLLRPQQDVADDAVHVEIGDPREFLDDVLVSPAAAVARSVYQEVVAATGGAACRVSGCSVEFPRSSVARAVESCA